MLKMASATDCDRSGKLGEDLKSFFDSKKIMERLISNFTL
jgi:hypothetical protein